MPSRLEPLVQHLDRTRAVLRAAADRVPADLHARRAAPDRWSVAEILEHLAIVERNITVRLAKGVAEAKTAGMSAAEEDPNVATTLQTVPVLDRTRKLAAPPQIHPTGTMSTEAVLARLEETRRALKDVIAGAEGLALGAVSFPHPAFGPLNLYQWISLAGSHEERHARQIEELGSQLESRST